MFPSTADKFAVVERELQILGPTFEASTVPE